MKPLNHPWGGPAHVEADRRGLVGSRRTMWVRWALYRTLSGPLVADLEQADIHERVGASCGGWTGAEPVPVDDVGLWDEPASEERDDYAMTLGEIGEEMGLSRSQVAHLIERALEKLRHRARHGWSSRDLEPVDRLFAGDAMPASGRPGAR